MILSFDLMMLGFFTLVYIIVTFFVGIKIITKYFEFRNKVFLYIGISYLGAGMPWSGVALNYISVVFFDTIPSMELHFFLHGATIPFFLFFWVTGILYLSNMKSNLRTIIIVLSAIGAIITEIIYLTIIFTDTQILGELINEIQVDYALFSEIYLLIAGIIMIAPGFWLGAQSLKSENKKVHLKGKLLIISYVLYTLATALEVSVSFIPIIILARILVAFCSILFYGGFILPKWMEKLFLRENEE